MRQYGDLDRYWIGYLGLEKEFLDFTNLVPLISENEGVQSPKLANIASLAGNWVETTFKRMAESGWPFDTYQGSLPTEVTSIDVFRETFEPLYRLSQRAVFVKRYLTEFHRKILPFECFHDGQNPKWFREYSNLKHNRLELQKRMTLETVTDAMAGLFLLNVYPHEMREYLLDQNIIRCNGPYTYETIKEILLAHPFLLPNEIPLRAWVEHPILAQTQLFSFEFPRPVGPNNPMEREGYLESLWNVSTSRT